MTRHARDKAAMTLGAGALLSSLFALSPGSHLSYDFVQLRGAGLAVILAAGAAAVVGGLLAARAVVLVAGAAFLGAAIVQVVQLGGETNWLQGNGSTFSLLLGFGAGLAVVGLVPDRPREKTT